MVDLGFFAMPVHPPQKNYGEMLRQNRDALVLCDQLGCTEAWIGEHFTSKSEPIPDTLQFLAYVAALTENIRLGTAALQLPLHKPVQLAGQIAQFDQLTGGRAMIGIGPGGLRSDLELFGVVAEEGYFKMVESVEIMTKLWTEDPPYDIKAQYWDDISLQNFMIDEYGVGVPVRPLQQPHPPIAYAMRQPSSGAMEIIVKSGWIPLSGNFIPASSVKSQWEAYCTACENHGKKPDPENWRAGRSILVAETDQQAEDYVAENEEGMRFYFEYLRMLEMRRNMPDASHAERREAAGHATNEALEHQIIIGSPKTVTDKLIAFRDDVGPFGTLLMTGHDWDDEDLWRGSIRRLAEEVMPVLSQHAEATDQL
jgi:alkanesulfonate monooxygenase SsuD/methylene tetrahydromethanopterin reductase-like flavin-dependent oxidoreductase (luciferase family)